jgi:hypothetical protein
MNPGGLIVTRAFVDELVHVAETMGSPHLVPIADRLRRPVRVAVAGRAGVGRGSVTAALRQRGIAIVPFGGGGEGFDVCVVVIAETVKPEEIAMARSAGSPVLIVLTKADLSGSGPGGPMAVARRRAVAVGRHVGGVRAVAMVGPLAALEQAGELDGDLVTALRRFVTEPPNLTSVDAFVDDPHPVDRDVRTRLLELLDRFGIAHAVLALADGCAVSRLPSHLARVGNLDEVLAALDAVAAPVRYRHVRDAVAELRSVAAQFNDDALADLLAHDVTVLAMMSAAVDVVEAAGLSVDRGDSEAAHLARAVQWARYGRGPLNALHRRCSADIVRGSLRLLNGVRTASA